MRNEQKTNSTLGIIAAVLVSYALGARPGAAQEGALDTSFGNGGSVMTTFAGVAQTGVADMAQQADGKLVAAGSEYTGTRYGFALARYTSTGALDATFGTGGKVITNVTAGNDFVTGIALQQDGKILAAGYSSTSTYNVFCAARYLTNGSLDTTFGTGGKLTLAVGSGHAQATAIALQTDGKILLAGTAVGRRSQDFAIVRLLANGSLDSKFGTKGVVLTDFGAAADAAQALAIDGAGNIVAAGYAMLSQGMSFAVARYIPDGTLDASFGVRGQMTTTVYGNESASTVAIQTDGSVLIGGRSSGGLAVLRYQSNGVVDPSFGNGGLFFQACKTADGINALALESDGGIVAVGKTACLWLTKAGALDPGYGTGGVVDMQPSCGMSFAASVLIQSDGRVAVGGTTFSPSGNPFTIARYLAE
jgi:uncharacterized delta-60 repeat protein